MNSLMVMGSSIFAHPLVAATFRITRQIGCTAMSFVAALNCAVWLAATLTAMLPRDAWAGAYASANQLAVQWLESQQDNSDGSWRDSSEERTFLQTAEAVLALHQANRRRAAYYAGQAWIENHEPKNLDARARRLLVLRATQSSAQPDIEALMAEVATPGAGLAGWGLAKRYRAAPLDTALALDSLRAAGATFSSSQVIAYLKATQLTPVNDQGWSAAAGSTTDAYTTARVVQALAAFRGLDPTLAVPLANAVMTLKVKVSTSSAPHVRAAAALAYLRMDPASNDAKALLDSLKTLQRPDGGFDAGVFATGLISQAFAAAEGSDAAAGRERVDLTDTSLRTAINEALGRGSMDQLNRGELSQLTNLDISGRGVTSLNGLQYAVNLRSLNAANNSITDLSPLAGLQLSACQFGGNPVGACQLINLTGPTKLPKNRIGVYSASAAGYWPPGMPVTCSVDGVTQGVPAYVVGGTVSCNLTFASAGVHSVSIESVESQLALNMTVDVYDPAVIMLIINSLLLE